MESDNFSEIVNYSIPVGEDITNSFINPHLHQQTSVLYEYYDLIWFVCCFITRNCRVKEFPLPRHTSQQNTELFRSMFAISGTILAWWSCPAGGGQYWSPGQPVHDCQTFAKLLLQGVTSNTEYQSPKSFLTNFWKNLCKWVIGRKQIWNSVFQ